MSDGVRQTGKYYLSFLFAVYLDGLLVELSKSGVGCYWRNQPCWTTAGKKSYLCSQLVM